MSDNEDKPRLSYDDDPEDEPRIWDDPEDDPRFWDEQPLDDPELRESPLFTTELWGSSSPPSSIDEIAADLWERAELKEPGPFWEPPRPTTDAPMLTAEMLTAAMTKAYKRVCAGSVLGYCRYVAYPDPFGDARETCTPKGRCKVGWIVSKDGSESWNVWVEVSTRLVKLVPLVMWDT
jgi:hypothetical protein